MADESKSHNAPEHVQAILRSVARLRTSGNTISDDEVLARHPHLAEPLASGLAKLRMIEQAGLHADAPDSLDTDTVMHDGTSRGSGKLRIRCPLCREPYEMASDAPLGEIVCQHCGSQFSLVSTGAETTAAAEFQRLAHFELVQRIGMGSFGTVWKGHDTQLDRTVAVKIPRQGSMDSQEIEKFLREARAAGQLMHPNIVTVHEVGRDGDSVFIVSDYVSGISLADWLTGQQPTMRQAAKLCAVIAEALHHAHQRGVIHRDLKPANVMIDAEGHPHLMDFGLARRDVGEVTLTLDGQMLGTPAYMSPEQARGESHTADRRSDVYSLGVILFQLLTGELPFRGNARMLVFQVIHDEPPSPRRLNASVPRDLETIVLKCLEKEPANRYQTASDVARELRRWLRHEPIEARPIGRTSKAWRWARRRPLVASLIALSTAALLALITGGAWYQTRLAGALADVEREHNNVREEQAKTRSVLYGALVGEAEYLNQVRPPGYGTRVWRLVDQARQLDTPDVDRHQLRQLAVRSLGHISFEEARRFDLGGKPAAADVTPDDQYLFVGLEDKQLVVLDLRQGHEIRRFEAHEHPVTAIRMLSAERVVTTDARCREVCVWKRDAQNVWSNEAKLQPEKHADILDLRLDESARHVLGWAGVRRDAFAAVVDYGTGRVADVGKMAVPDDARFAIRPFRLQEPDNSAVLEPTILSDVPASRIFDACPTHLIAANSYDDGGDNCVLVFHRERKKVEHRIQSKCGTILSAVVSRDGRFLAVSGHLGAEVFDCKSGERLLSLDDIGLSYVEMFVGDETNLLIDVIQAQLLYSLSEQKVIARFPRPTNVSRVRFSTSGRHWMRTDKSGIEIASVVPSELLTTKAHSKAVMDVTFSPDGRLFATSGDDDPIRVWEADSGRFIREFEGTQAAFHPSGRLLAIKTYDRLRLASVPEGKTIASIEDPVLIYRMRFNATGDLLAGIGWQEETFAVWRITPSGFGGEVSSSDSVRMERAVSDHTGVWDFCWSPSGRRLARYVGDGRVRIDNLDQPKRGFELVHDSDHLFRSLVFMGDDRLAFAAGGFQVWDLRRRKRLALPSEGNESLPAVVPITHSPDGRFLVLRNILVDVERMQRVFELPVPDTMLWCLDWSPGGRRLACGFDGGKLLVWDLAAIQQRLATLELDWGFPEYRSLEPLKPLRDFASAAPAQ